MRRKTESCNNHRYRETVTPSDSDTVRSCRRFYHISNFYRLYLLILIYPLSAWSVKVITSAECSAVAGQCHGVPTTPRWAVTLWNLYIVVKLSTYYHPQRMFFYKIKQLWIFADLVFLCTYLWSCAIDVFMRSIDGEIWFGMIWWQLVSIPEVSSMYI